jgi:hypothetical protein
MPPRKQTLGYASRTDAVVDLRRNGKTLNEIARVTGIEPKTVSALLISTKRRRQPSESGTRPVAFDIATLERLVPHAHRRGHSAHELARRIVQGALDDGLIDAILDEPRRREMA